MRCLGRPARLRRGRVPRGARPAGALPDRDGAGQGRRRPLLRRSTRGETLGDRRRVRLRQVGDQPGHPRPAQGHARPRSPARSGSTARSWSVADDEDDARAARRQDGDDLPGPAVVAAPVLHGRRPDRRGLPGAQRRLQGGGPASARSRCSSRVGIPNAGQAGRRLPAPVLRRHAPARHDRDGAGQRPQAAHRRRADHGARRDRAGADPRADEGPAAGVQLGDHPHHARPRAWSPRSPTTSS